MSAPKYSVGQPIRFQTYSRGSPETTIEKIEEVITTPRYRFVGSKILHEEVELTPAGGRKPRSRSRKHRRKTRKH